MASIGPPQTKQNIITHSKPPNPPKRIIILLNPVDENTAGKILVQTGETFGNYKEMYWYSLCKSGKEVISLFLDGKVKPAKHGFEGDIHVNIPKKSPLALMMSKLRCLIFPGEKMDW